MSWRLTETDEQNRYPLGTIDLFAWIAGAAFVAALHRWTMQGSLVIVVGAFFTGLQIAGLFAFGRARKLNLRFPTAPGHLLLLFGATQFLMGAIYRVLRTLASEPGEHLRNRDWMTLFFGCSVQFMLTLLGICCVLMLRKMLLWQIYFAFISMQPFLWFLHNSSRFLAARWPDNFLPMKIIFAEYAPSLFINTFWLAFAWMIICIVYDLVAGRRWDIWHWCGIISAWGFALHVAFNYLK